VLGLGDAPPEQLEPGLREALTEYVHVPDMERHEAALRATAYLVWRHGRIDHLDSLNEHWLALEGQLREDFNIPGLRPAELQRHRSKTGMDEVFRQAGLRAPASAPITSPARLRDFAAAHGFPLIIKPDLGVGATHTFRVDDQASLDRALAEPLAGHVVQEFITGTVTTYDGLTDRDGKVIFATSFVYAAGVMEFVNEQRDVHYSSRRVIPPALEEAGRRVIEAFRVRGRFFHAEFFELADGSFRPLEINLRPPGGFTTDLFNYAHDIDVYGLWADMVTGADLDGFRHEPRYHAAHVARRDQHRYRRTPDELIALLGPALMIRRRLPAPINHVMGDDLYLIRHESAEAMNHLIAAIHERA
jgi:biotin carboxylase